jgi:hypothetical protein
MPLTDFVENLFYRIKLNVHRVLSLS